MQALSPATERQNGKCRNENRTSGPVAPKTFQHASRRPLFETLAANKHLVFNPISGALDVLDDHELALLQKLQRGEPAIIPPSLERQLRARRYLFEDAEEEEEYLEVAVGAAWDRMQARQPEMYTVCPTLACNLACAYCFEGDSLTDKPQGTMTELQVKQLFQTIAQIRREAADHGKTSDFPPHIALFGGEPLLPSTKACVAQILQQASANGFLVGATTNGVNVTRFADLFSEYRDILTTFQVTLDGPQAVHDSRRHRLGGQGTFAEIVRGIDLLLSLGIDVDLRVNLDATNLSALPELLDFICEKRWPEQQGFQLALASVTQHAESGCSAKAEKVLSEMEMAQGVLALMEIHPNVDKVCHMGFLRHLEHLVGILEPEKRARHGRSLSRVGPRYWYCEASTDKQFVFTPEGLIYSCTEAVGKPQHAIGRFDPEFTLWQEETRQWIGRTVLSHPQCRACSISTLCGGGCNFAARESQASSKVPASSEALIQVFVKSKSKDHSSGWDAGAEREEKKLMGKKLVGKNRQTLPVSAYRNTPVSPYCNAAEQTVRAYLQHVGKQLRGNTLED